MRKRDEQLIRVVIRSLKSVTWHECEKGGTAATWCVLHTHTHWQWYRQWLSFCTFFFYFINSSIWLLSNRYTNCYLRQTNCISLLITFCYFLLFAGFIANSWRTVRVAFQFVFLPCLFNASFLQFLQQLRTGWGIHF